MISGHERVDGLVVRHAGADRVRQAHATEAIAGEQPGHAEHRVRAEGQRIEEVVVDAAVDDVHAATPLRRAHEDGAVVDEEVGALHELHAHRLGQEAQCSK